MARGSGSLKFAPDSCLLVSRRSGRAHSPLVGRLTLHVHSGPSQGTGMGGAEGGYRAVTPLGWRVSPGCPCPLQVESLVLSQLHKQDLGPRAQGEKPLAFWFLF